jgi:hypothetical protein
VYAAICIVLTILLLETLGMIPPGQSDPRITLGILTLTVAMWLLLVIMPLGISVNVTNDQLIYTIAFIFRRSCYVREIENISYRLVGGGRRIGLTPSLYIEYTKNGKAKHISIDSIQFTLSAIKNIAARLIQLNPALNISPIAKLDPNFIGFAPQREVDINTLSDNN